MPRQEKYQFPDYGAQWLFLIPLAIPIIVIVVALLFGDGKEAPCSAYRDFSSRNVPARCYDGFKGDR